MTTATPILDPQSATRSPIIELTGVTKLFPATRRSEEVTAVEDLNLKVEDKAATTKEGFGEFLVLLGPSGCGKSTILSMISGLALPERGEVLVYGTQVTGPHKFSASVPQAYTCFPWLNALQNVEFGLSLQEGISESERRDRANDYLNKVGLKSFAHSYHKQLSGGMQQRVAIARTLALKRPIVLMDEPFGALDAQTRAEMQQMLLALWEQEKSTIVFVTHDINEALLLADRIIVFSKRPATIVRDMGDIEKLLGHKRPPAIVHEKVFVERAEELRQLLGHGNPEESVPASAPVGAAKTVQVAIPSNPVPGGAAVVTQQPANAPVAAQPAAGWAPAPKPVPAVPVTQQQQPQRPPVPAQPVVQQQQPQQPPVPAQPVVQQQPPRPPAPVQPVAQQQPQQPPVPMQPVVQQQQPPRPPAPVQPVAQQQPQQPPVPMQPVVQQPPPVVHQQPVVQQQPPRAPVPAQPVAQQQQPPRVPAPAQPVAQQQQPPRAVAPAQTGHPAPMSAQEKLKQAWESQKAAQEGGTDQNAGANQKTSFWGRLTGKFVVNDEPGQEGKK
jgi:ABC-type nitrate/sulfonate/bicarbonate transport system ATPase subunit